MTLHTHTMVKVGEATDREGDVVAEIYGCTDCDHQERRS